MHRMEQVVQTLGSKHKAILEIQVRRKGSLSMDLRTEKRAHKVSSFCVSRTEMKTLSPSGSFLSRYLRIFALSFPRNLYYSCTFIWHALSNFFFLTISVIVKAGNTARLQPVRWITLWCRGHCISPRK